MSSKINIIIAREFTERVAKKSFIITTLLMPIIMVAFMAAPALIAAFSTPSERTIADKSELIWPALTAEKPEHVSFVKVANADSVITNQKYDAVLEINEDIVSNKKSTVRLYMHDAGSMELESKISSIINDAIESKRLKDYNIENLDVILNDINSNISLQTIRLDESGNGENTSSIPICLESPWHSCYTCFCSCTARWS